LRKISEQLKDGGVVVSHESLRKALQKTEGETV